MAVEEPHALAAKNAIHLIVGHQILADQMVGQVLQAQVAGAQLRHGGLHLGGLQQTNFDGALGELIRGHFGHRVLSR